MKKIIIFLVFLLTFISFPVSAHPGRTAADGCHYCRTNCDKWGVPWNERHCHGGSPVSIPTYIDPVEQRLKEQKAMIDRTSGYILLQIESKGEAWYVDPVSQKRYYLKNGEDAYTALRKFGLGITNKNINKIPKENSTSIAPSSLKGRILLQVEDNGEAWYVYPKNHRRYYLKNGNEAYRIMRDLGLGITNVDLDKIPIGSLN